MKNGEAHLFFFSSKKVPVRRTGAYRHEKALAIQRQTSMLIRYSVDCVYMKISRDIDDKVNVYMDAVRRIRNAYNGGQINVEIRLPLCCTSELKNLVYDQSFMQAVRESLPSCI